MKSLDDRDRTLLGRLVWYTGTRSSSPKE